MVDVYQSRREAATDGIRSVHVGPHDLVSKFEEPVRKTTHSSVGARQERADLEELPRELDRHHRLLAGPGVCRRSDLRPSRSVRGLHENETEGWTCPNQLPTPDRKPRSPEARNVQRKRVERAPANECRESGIQDHRPELTAQVRLPRLGPES